MDIPRLVIAGTQSGVGKTSLTLGLVALLRRRGLRVQTFKVGPDYLDPGYLALASGRHCYNLDGWMMGRPHVETIFRRASADADIAIIEGVMGLFDGADPASSEGSTAEIARWLDAPVLLVVNAHGMARSLAAVVHGYASFDPQLRMAGVIANRCGSERHARWLGDSLKAAKLPPLLGSVGRDALPELPSRHLGLVTADSTNLSPALLDNLADALEAGLSLDAIMEAARQAGCRPTRQRSPSPPNAGAFRYRLGVARDEAFHFYYPDNLQALEQAGCKLVPFSPIHDAALPQNLSGIYFGGGYPEEHAAALAANQSLLQQIRQSAVVGGLIYAECGGLMYLAEGIETISGERHALLGLLPAWTRMCPRRKSLGYVEVTLSRDSLWGKRGERLRGHEFHYSELVGSPTAGSGWQTAYEVRHRQSDAVTAEGFQRDRVLASYTHIHFASRPEAVRHFVARLAESRHTP
ncbi:MAG: cobyrinate a,c-diamide synthase [Verrucomicrobia bacterium]|nr:cobyrinate a,c-diamide synthase [Verrucomicrobiota bacterium]